MLVPRIPSYPGSSQFPQWAIVTTILLLATSLVGCKKAIPKQTQTKPQLKPQAKPSKKSPKSPETREKRNIVLFLGDSLTAGYRLASSEAYPALIGQHWKKQGRPWRTRNAGVSGDTSAGVIRRLNWVLTPDVHTVFLAIGANDGMRGQSLTQLEKNLVTILTSIRKKKVHVILAGIKIPRNYGKTYYLQFEEIYPRLAARFKIPLMPFLLKDVAGIKKLNLTDGIHPNRQGHQIISRNVLSYFNQAKLFSD